MVKQCRECQRAVSDEAFVCPGCGAPFPTRPRWDGWGFEYKSQATLLNLPLVHISFKFRPNRMPVPAKGIIAIGQFGIGVINVSQFGVGFISFGQFTLAFYAIAQFGFAYSLIAQMGIYLHYGYGQFVRNFFDLIAPL